MTENRQAAPSRGPRRRRRRLWPRLALSAFTFLFVLAVAEGMTRLLVAPPAPVRLRDGLYMNVLGKVNGFDTRTTYRGEPLPEAKRPGEIRIAVFGESTVQGSPWEGHGSPPAMLLDHLRRELPGRDLTVLNMGRGSGFTIDSYYFLASLGPFHPDYVILYQGANDDYRGEFEVCAPAAHPRLHRAWRFLVERSRLAWTIRARGPIFLAERRGRRYDRRRRVAPDLPMECDPERGYKGWVDAIVETAQGMGAKVIVATAVSNPLRWADSAGQFNTDRPLELEGRPAPYYRVLGCLLERGCDVGAQWRKEIEAGWPGLQPISWLLPRVRLCAASAAEHGARFIDFHQLLTDEMTGGLDPLLFVDEMHLTLEGEWLLAWRWAREVASLLDGRTLAARPPPLDKGAYLPAVLADLRRDLTCVYLSTVPIFLQTNLPLVASVQLRLALDSMELDERGLGRTRAGMMVQVVAGYLRRRIGLDAGIPAALGPAMDAFDPVRLGEAIMANRDCSTVGGAALDALVPPPPQPPPPLPSPPPPVELVSVLSEESAEAVVALLRRTSPDGCHLANASASGNRGYIHVEYDCGAGRVAVDLQHPLDSAGEAAASSARFAVVPRSAPPTAAFLRELAAALRDGESAVEWRRVPRPGSAPSR